IIRFVFAITARLRSGPLQCIVNSAHRSPLSRSYRRVSPNENLALFYRNRGDGIGIYLGHTGSGGPQFSATSCGKDSRWILVLTRLQAPIASWQHVESFGDLFDRITTDGRFA